MRTINEDVLKMLRNQAGSSLEEKRCYDPEKDHMLPSILLMETVLNITLRQDQVDNIRKFAEAAGKINHRFANDHGGGKNFRSSACHRLSAHFHVCGFQPALHCHCSGSIIPACDRKPFQCSGNSF